MHLEVFRCQKPTLDSGISGHYKNPKIIFEKKFWGFAFDMNNNLWYMYGSTISPNTHCGSILTIKARGPLRDSGQKLDSKDPCAEEFPVLRGFPGANLVTKPMS